jgi:hypothetical protein
MGAETFPLQIGALHEVSGKTATEDTPVEIRELQAFSPSDRL